MASPKELSRVAPMLEAVSIKATSTASLNVAVALLKSLLEKVKDKTVGKVNPTKQPLQAIKLTASRSWRGCGFR